MIDLKAPIIPWVELGGIRLYSHLNELRSLLEEQKAKPHLLGKFLIRYEIEDKIDLWFNIINGKLFKITALNTYEGKLESEICIGMKIEDVLKIDPSYIYDDFEEVYISPKGIYIETDPLSNKVKWISVFVKEIDDSSFEEGRW